MHSIGNVWYCLVLFFSFHLHLLFKVENARAWPGLFTPDKKSPSPHPFSLQYRLFIDTMFTQSIYFTVKSNPCTCMCADTPWTIFLRHVSLIEIVRGGRIINQRSTYGMQPFLDNQRIANLICKTSIYVCRFPPRSIMVPDAWSFSWVKASLVIVLCRRLEPHYTRMDIRAI